MVRAGETGETLTDDRRFKEVIAGIAAAYPRARFEQASVSIYYRALCDLPVNEVEGAVADLIRTSQYPPTIAEIRERAAERRLNLPSSTEAWLLVTERPHKIRDLPGPVQEALKAVGGTWAVRTTNNTIALRSQFVRAYEDLRAQAIRQVTSTRPALTTKPAKELTE